MSNSAMPRRHRYVTQRRARKTARALILFWPLKLCGPRSPSYRLAEGVVSAGYLAALRPRSSGFWEAITHARSQSLGRLNDPAAVIAA
jgi:hypothetical protein